MRLVGTLCAAERRVGRTYRGTRCRCRQNPLRGPEGGNERVNRRQGTTNRGLEEESRRLREEGAHRYRRREALTRRDRRREREILVEQLKKEQPSD
jgi:hypothetical protein